VSMGSSPYSSSSLSSSGNGASAGAPAGASHSAGAPVGADVHRGWFPLDAERHRRDAPRYCPGCAAALSLADGGFGLVTEYWTGQDRVFVCFCGACGWSGDIMLAARVTGHEAADLDRLCLRFWLL
jgi:hypothetical protein